MRVLIVEDNEMNRDLLGRRLRREGHVVTVAEDGAAGVERARLERPDIVLMDMNLPVLDGWEATYRLKSDPSTAAIPIVALTAHAFASERARAFEVGCDDFHTKPVDFRGLLSTMARLCPERETS